MLSRRAFPWAGRREPRVVARRGSGVERERDRKQRPSIDARTGLDWAAVRRSKSEARASAVCTSTERLCIAAWVTHSGVAATARAERAASGLSGFRGAKQTWALLAPLQKLCPISAGHASQSTLQDVIRGECCASRRPRSCAPLLLLLAPTTLLTQVLPPRCSARRPSSRPDSLTAASRSRTTPSMGCPGSSARTHSAPSLSTGSKASSLASTSSFAVSYSLSLSPTCARSPALIEIGTCHPDTDLENKSVLQTLKESARDPTRTLVFNYASEALNNSFFLSTLVSTTKT